MLPPARVTRVATRLRDGLLRLHRRSAPPPVQILESLFGLLDHRVLVALCEVGVPDALTGPTAVPDLAATVGADADTLDRLVRYGATRGWLRIDRRGRVRPTPLTEFLRRDHPGGWRAWVDFIGGDEVVGAVARLSATTDADAFAAANGAPFFEWMGAHPDRGAAFDAAMAAGGRMHALALAGALSWPAPGTVCDVGGGVGALLATLLDLVPGLTGTVLDLPFVVERAVTHERLTAVGGDAFESVPDGFDTYLLVNVVHDWGDDAVVRILRSIARAVPAGGRVVILDSESTPQPVTSVATVDVLMAALTPGGRERTTAEVGELARRAGLTLDGRTPLASGDVAWTLKPSF